MVIYLESVDELDNQIHNVVDVNRVYSQMKAWTNASVMTGREEILMRQMLDARACGISC
jgi:ferritin